MSRALLPPALLTWLQTQAQSLNQSADAAQELLPQLDPQQFWQIHRGTIVNASAIATAVRDDAGKLSLTLRQHPAQLRVSPLYAHLFRQM